MAMASQGRGGIGPTARTAAPAIGEPSPPRGGRPNVVLISIDSLRADHLGCYGYSRPTSPRIDELARGGMRFAAAWSSTSWTLPAHVSLLSGRSLLGHGVREPHDTIPPGVPLLAELLRAAGYATGAVVSAPYLSSRYGFARGFDAYDDHTVSYNSHADSNSGVTSPQIDGAASAWLRAQKRSPFFLFVHYWDPHYDYDPPPPYDTMFDPDYRGSIRPKGFYENPAIHRGMIPRDLDHVRALYDGEIRYTDLHVGRLLDLLAELGIRDQTLVILTADHGDEFFEHGRKGHERTLYEEVLHVPLIVSWPGGVPSGRVVTEPVSIMDVAPTVLWAAGLPPPPGMEGQALLPEISPDTRRPTLTAELYRRSKLNLQVAVRQGRRKLIQSLNVPRVEFYDLEADPKETVSALTEEERLTLRQGLAGWMSAQWLAQSDRAAPARVALEQGQVEALRALGYVE
jgi:arylsulfatase A-like enzyme